MSIGSLRLPVLGAVLGIALFAPGADATNGYFTHGYGTTNKGLAGAGVALPQDALAAATNPAGIVWLGKRYDVGLAAFNPNRHYEIEGSPSGFPGTFGLIPGKVESGSRLFGIPYFGANWALGSRASLGLSIYGHGGMNTDYPTATFFGSQPTGVDLSQLFIAPTWAHRVGQKHSFGATLILAYQVFEMKGVEAFGAFSAAPTKVSNNGKDTATGAGVKVGYLGQWSPRLSFGASYQSEIKMSEFDAYAGLFADQGDFDIPATFTVGFALKATEKVVFLIDLQKMYYSDITAVGNPLLPNLQQAPLGDGIGPGFGWDDMTVLKAGVQIHPGGTWTWRFGFSSGDQPIPESEMLFNILAPGVMEEHATVGFTKILQGNRAFSFSLMRALSSSVRGPNPLEVPGLQQIRLTMDQWDVEVAYSWGF